MRCAHDVQGKIGWAVCSSPRDLTCCGGCYPFRVYRYQRGVHGCDSAWATWFPVIYTCGRHELCSFPAPSAAALTTSHCFCLDHGPVGRGLLLVSWRCLSHARGASLPQVEVYSSALNSFHSDTIQSEEDETTATTLYEPTFDLITGHRNGLVFVYGKVESPAMALQQMSMPLRIDVSQDPITALHCVPLIELEAASAAAASLQQSPTPAQPAAPGAVQGSDAFPAAAVSSEVTVTQRGAATSPVEPTPAAETVSSCTADDVLLFSGTSAGLVKAVRFSRVDTDLLLCSVFLFPRRSQLNNNINDSSNNNTSNGNGNTRASSSRLAENPCNTEITGLLYRDGYLVVTNPISMFLVRVVKPPQQPTSNAGAGNDIRRGNFPLTWDIMDTISLNGYDRCTALVAIDWPVPGNSQTTNGHVDRAASDAEVTTAAPIPGGADAMPQSTFLPSWRRVGSQLPGDAAVSTDGGAVAAASTVGCAATGRTPKFVAARQGPWRMLSAHVSGQLLMWHVSQGKLKLVCTIGQPGPAIM